MERGNRLIVQVDVAAADAELAADALWQAGPSAVSEVALAGGRVRLTADIPSLGTIADRWPVEVLQVDGDAYLDAWRAFATPARAGRRIVLQPTWVEPGEVGPDDLVVVVDPGRAFGSGSHPATRVALAALEDHVREHDRVIDIGCGSGVLAITSLLLGAAEAEAVDIDLAAVDATGQNAARNGVAGALTVHHGSAGDVSSAGDIVVANIGLAVLRELGPQLVALVRRGGLLVLSGLLEDQVDAVVAPLTEVEVVGSYAMDGWVAPVLRRTT